MRQGAGISPRPPWIVAALALAALVGCGGTSSSPRSPAASATAEVALGEAQGTNPKTCVENFEPGRDYFPAKIRLRHAEQATVEYGPHYKRLVLHQPWVGAESPAQYLLVLCGTPPPAGFEDHVLIEIPVRTVVTTSTTELPHLVELGVVGRLVGHDEFDWVVSPEVRRRIGSGAVVEVGSAPNLDIERLVALAPGLVLADSLGDPQQGLLPRLRQIGLPVVLAPSFLETSPLGRAEWLKITALFFDREERAESFFRQVEGRYQELVRTVDYALDQGLPRPTVLMSGPTEDVWWVPGGHSFMARLLADAGARYPWADEPTSGSLPLAFESVLERAADAELWLHPGRFGSLADLLAVDSRLAHFRALREGRVYGNDAQTNDQGGNDYWESGSLRPDLVLADLVEIAHPELLELDLTYHRLLPAEPGSRP